MAESYMQNGLETWTVQPDATIVAGVLAVGGDHVPVIGDHQVVLPSAAFVPNCLRTGAPRRVISRS